MRVLLSLQRIKMAWLMTPLLQNKILYIFSIYKPYKRNDIVVNEECQEPSWMPVKRATQLVGV